MSAPPPPIRELTPVDLTPTPEELKIEQERRRRLHPDTLALREAMHRRLLEIVDLPSLKPEDIEDPRFRRYMDKIVDELLDEFADRIPAVTTRAEIKKDFLAETLGLGALEDLIADDSITEIMVIDRQTVYVERKGRLELVPVGFGSEAALRAVIERIIMPLGRRIDESQPLVDARLRDGSRVNAIIPPLALRGPALTIRKFSKRPYSLDELRSFGAMDERIQRFLVRCVKARKNIVVSGGTGSGKTTLLNALSQHIDRSERIITIEDSAELKLMQPHVVSLETRPANFEGQGAFTIRDLVKNALRMRPDRIIVGECRGGEALDMLQAMNTGHDGSLTTLHANNPAEAISRLETLCLMADVELPAKAIRAQIANAVHVIVQQTRYADGSRRISHVSEITGLTEEGEVEMHPLFVFQREPARVGAEHHERVRGRFRATGYVPTFMNELYALGLIKPGEAF
ncbi:MAG: CpaF family protein [Myxococcales bacterium]|nr:CpaF family protein [Myxococcota bacterium]MDW8282502.1 CpaF family protein [Myxococcales bacterium]